MRRLLKSVAVFVLLYIAVVLHACEAKAANC